MPIYWRCPVCRSLNSLSKKRCSCGALPPKTNKSYMVQVKYGGFRKAATAQTLAQARELEAILKEELIRKKYVGHTVKKESMTLAVFFTKHFLPWAYANLKTPKKDYESYFKNWVLPRLGGKKLDEISVSDVEALKMDVIRAGRSPRTVQHVLTLLKGVLSRAKEWGFFEGENPVSKVRLPKFDNRRIRFLTREEATKLLEKCREKDTPTNHIYLITLIALTTGMRAGEIFNLKWQDIDLNNDLIYVRDPKSGENRTAFLSSEVKKELLALKNGQEPSGFVFLNSKGQPLKRVPEVWETIIRDLGFNDGITDRREKVVFHTLRHTFCSWLAMEGVPLHVIKELAGHKTIQMTERYSHLMPDVRKKAAQKVWEKIGQPPLPYGRGLRRKGGVR